jgi:hypothetical protein
MHISALHFVQYALDLCFKLIFFVQSDISFYEEYLLLLFLLFLPNLRLWKCFC